MMIHFVRCAGENLNLRTSEYSHMEAYTTKDALKTLMSAQLPDKDLMESSIPMEFPKLRPKMVSYDDEYY
jgi:hypothetical protein